MKMVMGWGGESWGGGGGGGGGVRLSFECSKGSREGPTKIEQV